MLGRLLAPALPLLVTLLFPLPPLMTLSDDRVVGGLIRFEKKGLVVRRDGPLPPPLEELLAPLPPLVTVSFEANRGAD